MDGLPNALERHAMSAILDHAQQWKMSDLQHHLDDIPIDRIRLFPWPGTAAIDDVIEAGKPTCELVDGPLVDKPAGFRESWIASRLSTWILNYLDEHPEGIVAGEGGTVQLLPNQVRAPDAAYYSRDRLPGGRIPEDPVPSIYPDLAIEVLSKGNTTREMSRKRNEYFQAGVQLVWEIDPRSKTVIVYRSSDDSMTLSESDTLTGDPVFTGFFVPVQDLFNAQA